MGSLRVQWHHIVEQCKGNKARFGEQAIQNTENIIAIPGGNSGDLHNRITGHYNSIQETITGNSNITVREWLSEKSYEEQYEYGIDILNQLSK